MLKLCVYRGKCQRTYKKIRFDNNLPRSMVFNDNLRVEFESIIAGGYPLRKGCEKELIMFGITAHFLKILIIDLA